MGLTHVQGEWIPLQVKVFSRWFAAQLKNKSNIELSDISTDLTNGVALVELAKILTHKDTPRKWSLTPKRNIEMVQNCDLALDMFVKDGVNFIGISGRDINQNNEKLILGLVWTIISHYSFGDKKSQLLSWVIERTANYPNVEKFTPYDLSLCALLDSYVPEKINFYSLDPNDSDYNSQLALNTMKDLGIPLFIYPEDLKNQELKFDQQILLTQLAAAKEVLENLPPKHAEIEVVERSIELPEEILPIENEEIPEINQEKSEDLIENNNEITRKELEEEPLCKDNDSVVIEKHETNEKSSYMTFEDIKDTLLIVGIIGTMVLLVAFELEIL